MDKLTWLFKFHTGSTDFNAKELEMEFENEVQIDRMYEKHPSSPDIDFMPRGAFSKSIEIEFIDPMLPHTVNLFISLLAEKRPEFKKIIWKNKHQNRLLTFNPDQIRAINEGKT